MALDRWPGVSGVVAKREGRSIAFAKTVLEPKQCHTRESRDPVKVSRRRFLSAAAGGCACAAATPIGWYAGIHEPLDVETVYTKVSIRGLPQQLVGLRMVQVSDLHLSRTGDVHVRMIEQVRRLNPDLVVVTGDLVDVKSGVGEVSDLLSNLKPPRGVWVVPGNWDHDADAVDDLTNAFDALKIRFLVNESAQLAETLWMVGVDDPSSGNDDLQGSLQNVPAGSQRLLLAHSPDIVASLHEQAFDLILAGHTHGGQINLPVVNGSWLKAGLSREYVKGMFLVSGSPMYVNRGIGTTHLPLRIGARPEITHFTLDAT